MHHLSGADTTPQSSYSQRYTILSRVAQDVKFFSVVDLSPLSQYVDDLLVCSPTREQYNAVIEKPLRDLTEGAQLCALDRLTWTPEADKAVTAMKTALLSPPTLGFPDPNRSFHSDC